MSSTHASAAQPTANIVQYGFFCYELAIDMSCARHLPAAHEHGIATGTLTTIDVCNRVLIFRCCDTTRILQHFCTLP
jgi:hypothetical protein